MGEHRTAPFQLVWGLTVKVDIVATLLLSLSGHHGPWEEGTQQTSLNRLCTTCTKNSLVTKTFASCLSIFMQVVCYNLWLMHSKKRFSWIPTARLAWLYAWLGVSDDRWDRPLPTSAVHRPRMTAMVAPSIERSQANKQPPLVICIPL